MPATVPETKDGGTSLHASRFLSKQLQETSSFEGFILNRVRTLQDQITYLMTEDNGMTDLTREVCITLLMDLQMVFEAVHRQSHPEDTYRTPPSQYGRINPSQKIPF